MKTPFISLIVLLAATGVYAQQDAASTMFWNTFLHINPAMTGLEYRHEAHAQYRNQWDRVNGAPNTVWANYGARIQRIHGGAGFTYAHDAIGFNRQHEALANYAFHIQVKNSVLAVGVAGGLVNFASSPEWVPPTTLNDPSLPKGSSATAFTMNAGVAFHAPRWNAGFGSTNVNAPSLKQATVLGGGTITYNTARHYYVFGDYEFHIGSGPWSVRPRFIARTDMVKYSAQLSVVAAYSKAWLSFNYRTSDAVGFSGGYDFYGRYRVGYGYDLTVNQLSSVSRGTHEITLGFLLK